jgi:hypothetical protein
MADLPNGRHVQQKPAVSARTRLRITTSSCSRPVRGAARWDIRSTVTTLAEQASRPPADVRNFERYMKSPRRV